VFLGVVIMLLVTAAFPLLLLSLMLGMERIERPLRSEAFGQHLDEFLESARPEEIETYVAEGLSPALDRYWRRQRLSQRLGGR
jgi:hypothetical protein